MFNNAHDIQKLFVLLLHTYPMIIYLKQKTQHFGLAWAHLLEPPLQKSLSDWPLIGVNNVVAMLRMIENYGFQFIMGLFLFMGEEGKFNS